TDRVFPRPKNFFHKNSKESSSMLYYFYIFNECPPF
ncbi:hypothetical protein CP8484711_0823, partial [Chlamydia psittaci 84-8471/1]